jgi:hypothetical protein
MEFKFNIGDKVKIKRNSLVGEVISIFITRNCDIQYQVLFFDTTQRPCEWYMFAGDIELYND